MMAQILKEKEINLILSLDQKLWKKLVRVLFWISLSANCSWAQLNLPSESTQKVSKKGSRSSHRWKIRKYLFLFASWKDFAIFRTGPQNSRAPTLHPEQIKLLLEWLCFSSQRKTNRTDTILWEKVKTDQRLDFL